MNRVKVVCQDEHILHLDIAYAQPLGKIARLVRESSNDLEVMMVIQVPFRARAVSFVLTWVLFNRSIHPQNISRDLWLSKLSKEDIREIPEIIEVLKFLEVNELIAPTMDYYEEAMQMIETTDN